MTVMMTALTAAPALTTLNDIRHCRFLITLENVLYVGLLNIHI